MNLTLVLRIVLAFCLSFVVLNSIYDGNFTSSTFRRVKTLHMSEEDVFVQNVMESDIAGDYDGSPLQSLCAQTKWREGLIFSCGRVHGGIGNVRNLILNCVRFAIAAGAEFIVPVVEKRSTGDIVILEGNGFLDFGDMFDKAHFINTLRIDCPQMRLWNSVDELWDKPSAANVFSLTPRDLDGNRLFGHTMMHPEHFASAFTQWLKDRLAENPLLIGPSAAEPVRVDLPFPLLHWRVAIDPADFVTNFGRMLRFPHAVRSLSAKVLYSLSKRHNLRLQSTGITPNAFMGLHLRTERDARISGFESYEKQTSFLLKYAEQYGFTLLYTASGSTEESERFRKEAWEKHDRRVITKFDLLSPSNTRLMEALRWDQQALVDFGVMERASVVAGNAESSFAYGLAVRRHACSIRSEYKIGGGGDASFLDEYSVMMGAYRGSQAYFAIALWP